MLKLSDEMARGSPRRLGVTTSNAVCIGEDCRARPIHRRGASFLHGASFPLVVVGASTWRGTHLHLRRCRHACTCPAPDSQVDANSPFLAAPSVELQHLLEFLIAVSCTSASASS